MTAVRSEINKSGTHCIDAHVVLRLLNAPEQLDVALRLPIALHGDPRLHLRALELAGEHNLSATYDAQYLALAERFRAPLWTGDRRLTNKLHGDVPVVHLVP